MLLNIKPLIRYREYRLLFIGQTVSFMGSMITYVALPWQVYNLTRSSFYVGLLATIQLVPLILFGLWGGVVADSMDRKKILLYSEIAMSLGSLALLINAVLPHPSLLFIFVATGLIQAANGFHRPVMDAIAQKLVEKEDYPSLSALNSLRYGLGAVMGPGLAGIIIGAWGVKAAYFIDFLSFGVAVASILKMKPIPKVGQSVPALKGIQEGLHYAFSNPILLGSYLVDIAAMTFAFSTALYPAMGDAWGGPKVAGILFSAMPAGSLLVTLFSGWSSRVRRHGAIIVVSAAIWGVAMLCVGFSRGLIPAFICLALAGGADMISGIFRSVIWNETIPNEKRGRLASIEMISYMIGPLCGNTRAGFVASVTSVPFSLISGGVLCFVGVVACGFLFPQLWKYRSVVSESVAA